MKKFNSIILAAGLLVGGIVSVLAAGAFSNYPGVGVQPNTNCTSYGNNNVCYQYQPAGPSFLQGTETFPADTNYLNPQGNAIQPYTITVPTSYFAQGMGNAQVVTTNANVAIANGVSTLIFNASAGTVALINLPANPSNNQVVTIATVNGAMALTSIAVATGSGQSIVGTAPTTIAALSATAASLNAVKYLYQSSNSTWYRIQ